MKRKIVITLLTVGTIAGFAIGFGRLHRHHHMHRDEWKDHVAEVCVRAAERIHIEKASSAPTAPDAL